MKRMPIPVLMIAIGIVIRNNRLLSCVSLRVLVGTSFLAGLVFFLLVACFVDLCSSFYELYNVFVL